MAESRGLPELLPLLEDALSDQGAQAILERLRPGLSDQEMDDLTNPLGIVLPGEAKQWFAWHDGSWSTWNTHALTPLFSTLPLATAVAEAWKRRAAEPDPPPDEALWPWPWSWLPVGLSDVGRVTAIDCALPARFAAPVVVRDWHTDTELPRPQVASIADLVDMWLQAIDVGAYRFDANVGHWVREWDRLSIPLQQLI